MEHKEIKVKNVKRKKGGNWTRLEVARSSEETISPKNISSLKKERLD